MKLHDYYPFLIVLGGIFTLTLYSIWNRSYGDTARELDPADRLIALCVIVVVMVVGFIIVQSLQNSRLNTAKAKVIFQEKTQVCREMPNPGDRTLCMMQVVK